MSCVYSGSRTGRSATWRSVYLASARGRSKTPGVEQYVRTVGVVDLEEQQIDADCLRMLNRRQAWQFQTLPLSRDDDQHINMATSPENLVRAVNFASRKLDEPICFQLAERQQLMDFLMRHYPVPDHIAEFAGKL